MIRIAILDDYQNASLEMADWSPLAGRAEITVFNDHLSDFDNVVERLLPFDVVCVMRERTPLPRSVIGRLPRLKRIASTGHRNAAIDVEAAAERGIAVAHTGYDARPTIEMTWALILASARQVALENAKLRSGGWQLTMGESLHGETLGVLGLGNIGSEVARIGLAFGMQVIAWSQNLTPDSPWRTIPQGAATSVWAGVVAPADVVGGRYCEDCHVAETDDGDGVTAGVRSYALDPERAKALWARSEEMVGERF